MAGSLFTIRWIRTVTRLAEDLVVQRDVASIDRESGGLGFFLAFGQMKLLPASTPGRSRWLYEP